MASDMEKEKDDEKVHEVSEELDSDSDEKEEETNDGEKITSQIFFIMLIGRINSFLFELYEHDIN